MDITREKLEEMMSANIDEIVEYWNENGQIIENEFPVISSYIIKHYADIVMDIITSNQNYDAENDQLENHEDRMYDNIACNGDEVAECTYIIDGIPAFDGTFVNTIYSKNRITKEQAKRNVDNYEKRILADLKDLGC